VGNSEGKQGRFFSARTQIRPFEEAHEGRVAIKIAIRHRLLLKRRMMPMLGVGRPPVSSRTNPAGKFDKDAYASIAFAIRDPQSKIENSQGA
jgi:hypothetical protein